MRSRSRPPPLGDRASGPRWRPCSNRSCRAAHVTGNQLRRGDHGRRLFPGRSTNGAVTYSRKRQFHLEQKRLHRHQPPTRKGDRLSGQLGPARSSTSSPQPAGRISSRTITPQRERTTAKHRAGTSTRAKAIIANAFDITNSAEPTTSDVDVGVRQSRQPAHGCRRTIKIGGEHVEGHAAAEWSGCSGRRGGRTLKFKSDARSTPPRRRPQPFHHTDHRSDHATCVPDYYSSSTQFGSVFGVNRSLRTVLLRQAAGLQLVRRRHGRWTLYERPGTRAGPAECLQFFQSRRPAVPR